MGSGSSGDQNPRPDERQDQPQLPGQEIPQILPPTSKPQLIFNEIAIQKKSVKLIQNETNPSIFSVSFIFDVLVDCLITFYFLVKEIKDPTTELTLKY